MKKSLTNIFLCAALFMGEVGCSRPKTQEPDTPPYQPIHSPVSKRSLAPAPTSSRLLTSGEKRIAASLFGRSIDLSRLYLNFYADENANFASDVADGETDNIDFYGPRFSSDDYSQEKNAFNFGAFICEITHIWQNQAGTHWHHGDVKGAPYPLGLQRSFDNYGPDQQQAIMMDYALRFLHPARHAHWLARQYEESKDNDLLLSTLVENKFKGAKSARLAFENIKSRPLTSGERALALSIFGKKIDGDRFIDADRVKIYFHPERNSDTVASVENMGAIDYWGEGNSSDDFSRENNVFQFGIFTHEITHIWQRQTGAKYTTDNGYVYPLRPDLRFTGYGKEQQAAIMEDYARYFLNPAKSLRYLPTLYSGSDLTSRIPLLQKLVEDQFPAAKATRQAYEARSARISSAPLLSRFKIWVNAL